MRRREFLGVVGGAAVWPLVAQAQPTMRAIGYLSSRSRIAESHFQEAFYKGLHETGYELGKNLTIIYKWAEGHNDQLPSLAADLVREQVAVILATGGRRSVEAAKAATDTIPIVFTTGSDPVKIGLVRSLARPDKNVTGVAVFTVALGPKRLEILNELVPKTATIAVLANPLGTEVQLQLSELSAAAQNMRRDIKVLYASNEREIDLAFTQIAEQRLGGLLYTADTFYQTLRDKLVALAMRHKIPAMYEWRTFVDAGGLASYSTVRTEAFELAGVYVGRILNGASPKDLPVIRTTKFEFVINRKTAKTLGIEIPPKLLFTADEVIE